MENLGGCAKEIREYELERERLEAEAKHKVLESREAAKRKADEEAAARAQEAAAAAAEGGAEENPEQPSALRGHRQKKHPLWECFDLQQEKPCCKLPNPAGGGICGATPSTKAGTSNFWAHLWTHHRAKWYELKRAAGQLNAAGKAELEHLSKMLQQPSLAGQAHGGTHLKGTLTGAAKQTMDRLTAEWIVDEDQPFSAAATPGFKRMMFTATGGKYDGCCAKTVKANISGMAKEGKQEVIEFHKELLDRGVKPSASGDLWSKNRTALFGLISHGIQRRESTESDGTSRNCSIYIYI
ncbi:hypothetical protein AB1Y20_015832 [Prymnesium parvum]